MTSQIPKLRSPQPSDDTSPQLTPDMSSDENDDDAIIKENIKFDYDSLETHRQRCSPSDRSKVPKSNCDVDAINDPATPSRYSRRKSTEKKTANLPSEKWSGWKCWLVGILIMVIGFFIAQNSLWTDKKESKVLGEMEKFKESIKEIKGNFPGQNRRTWTEIEAGINDLINGSEKPWIFVLYSNETRAISCLAKMLGKASSKALHSKKSLELQARDLGDDYGRAIESLKSEINATKAVVVHDLLKIDPRAIQAFHTMCDRENPLVKSAVYVITIITSGNIPQFEKPVVFVENQLTNRFINKVPEDKLQPLITRLTDGPILPVNPEINFAGCPL